MTFVFLRTTSKREPGNQSNHWYGWPSIAASQTSPLWALLVTSLDPKLLWDGTREGEGGYMMDWQRPEILIHSLQFPQGRGLQSWHRAERMVGMWGGTGELMLACPAALVLRASPVAQQTPAGGRRFLSNYSNQAFTRDWSSVRGVSGGISI